MAAFGRLRAAIESSWNSSLNATCANTGWRRGNGGIWISGTFATEPPLQGAGIFPALEVESTEFVYNKADVQGGGIFANIMNDSWIVNTRFDSNLAVTGGGGAYLGAVKDQKTFDFANCVFWENWTNSNAGGIMFGHVDASANGFSKSRVVNCTMVGNYNTACTAGTAVTWSVHSQAKIFNSIAYYNYSLEVPSACPLVDNFAWASAVQPVIEYTDAFMVSGPYYGGNGNMNTSPKFRSGNPPPHTPFDVATGSYAVGPALKLKAATATVFGSDCVDAADYGQLLDDLADLNNDGLTIGQKVTIDLVESNRFVNRTLHGEDDVGAPPLQAYLDMGAYEVP